MEGGVEVVVEWEAPFQGGGRGVVVGGEEVGEGFNLGPAEVEKAVVEDAQKPHPSPTINYMYENVYTGWDRSRPNRPRRKTKTTHQRAAVRQT